MQLILWKDKINNFLRNNLYLELHPEKSKIISISKGIDFVGFRNFYYYKLLRKRNIIKFHKKLNELENKYANKIIGYDEVYDYLEGWIAYANQANTYNFRKVILENFEKEFKNEISYKEINRYLKK